MTEAEFHNLLQRYLDNQCTAEEQASVERWYERLDKVEASSFRSQNQEAVEDAIWQRLVRSKTVSAPDARIVRHPASFWQNEPLKWVAALLVVGSMVGLLFSLNQWAGFQALSQVATNDGWLLRYNQTQQVQRFTLPDSSIITLHPGSRLRYQTAFAGPRREVYLQGEAFFKVHKNPARPFLVFTKQVVTTVLGTSFRVKAYAGSSEASVTVREGKVAVQASRGAKLYITPAQPATNGVLLLPNEQVVYSATSRYLKKQLVTKPTLLRPQTFEFEERPVSEVLNALEKAYGVDILYDKAKLTGCTVSISFENETLFEKLDMLCKSLGARYTLTNEKIAFRSTGCELSSLNK